MNDVNGLLIIDKPAGMTSHDVVARVRRILRTRRVGHTGTLDPFATGVMVLLIGSATRLARFVDKDEKEYEALIQFGWETDTGDRTGTRNADTVMAPDEVIELLDTVDWGFVFAKFRGEIMQTPPMYSAKKVDGKKLYELARKGKDVERKPVRIVIHEIERLPDQPGVPLSTIRIRVVCSAGTYIRTLAEDIGREIGARAHLAELRRTKAGQFGLERALTLEQLQDLPQPAEALQPMTELVAHLPEMKLLTERVARTRNGLSTRVDADEFSPGASIRMVDESSNLVAVGIYDGEQNVVQPKIILV